MTKLQNILQIGLKLSFIAGVTITMSACGASDRIADIGKAPKLTQIQNPKQDPRYKPVSLPMPDKKVEKMEKNSLWSASRQTFFKDQRAKEIGDILTVKIDIADKADIENETERTRDNSENAGLTNLLGIESQLSKVLPEAVTPSALANGTSASNSKGTGTIKRDETIELDIAAMITEVLPNGNFVIKGHQEVRVNFEVRELGIMGVIRPEDISMNNTISSDKIAEARVSYGGRGHLTDVQQPRYGQQFYDIVFPF